MLTPAPQPTASTDEKVKEGEAVEAIHERAKMIVELETMYPWLHRLERYVHLLETAEVVVDTPNAMAEGISGRVKQELGKLELEIKDVRGQMRTMNKGVDKLNAQVLDLTKLVERALAVQRPSQPSILLQASPRL